MIAYYLGWVSSILIETCLMDRDVQLAEVIICKSEVLVIQSQVSFKGISAWIVALGLSPTNPFKPEQSCHMRKKTYGTNQPV